MSGTLYGISYHNSIKAFLGDIQTGVVSSGSADVLTRQREP